MKWLLKLLDKLLSIIANLFEEIVQLWGIVRAVVILLLVLYTIVENVHQQIDKDCETLTYENYTNVDYALCYHIHCGGGCFP